MLTCLFSQLISGTEGSTVKMIYTNPIEWSNNLDEHDSLGITQHEFLSLSRRLVRPSFRRNYFPTEATTGNLAHLNPPRAEIGPHSWVRTRIQLVGHHRNRNGDFMLGVKVFRLASRDADQVAPLASIVTLAICLISE